MSTHDDQIRLRHMLDHAREATVLVQGKSCADFKRDRVLQLALVRLIEIVGEAANRVSKTTQGQHPQLAWPQIIGMRHRLIHGYDFIDLDILWQTVTTDLPPLIAELEQLNKNVV